MIDPAVTSEAVKRKNDSPDSTEETIDAKRLKQDTEVSTSENKITNKVRRPKKVAMLLCYLGKNYYGMQKNHGVNTVEGELFSALLKANVILQHEYDTPQNMKFQRAARTDKGVSAVRQVVSLKIPLDDISDTFAQKVNPHLPPEIKILCVKRVTQSFDAKIACDFRSYAYMLPTFAFCEDINQAEDYRITDEQIQKVNEFLKSFIGTHNYYNFTSGRGPKDMSCQRYIVSCECEKPFMNEGLEFIIIKVKGQSFILHQIRKMVGLTIAVIRNLVAVESIFPLVWKSDRVDVPMAPGLGLMLEEVHYNWYNNKYGDDGMHAPLVWDEYQGVIDQFREEQIYKNIALTERKEKSMLQWLETLSLHTFDVRASEAPTKVKLSSEDENNDQKNDVQTVVSCQ